MGGYLAGRLQVKWTSVHGDEVYFRDTLFRDERGTAVSEDAAHGIVTRIFVRSLGNDGQLSAEDRTCLAEAEQRVGQVYANAHQAVEDAKVKAKEAADTAAKVAAWTTLWMFITLLIGAFFASLCATVGGRRRDAVTSLATIPPILCSLLILENKNALTSAVFSRYPDPDHHSDRPVCALTD